MGGERVGLTSIDQLGFVVADLDVAAASFSRELGLGSWRSWLYDGALLDWRERDGEPSDYAMRLAVAGSGPQIELIEPVAGDTVYDGWLRSGESARLHHLGSVVDSFADARRGLEAGGLALAQGGGGHGADGDGAFGYFDTTASLGIWIELIESPRTRVAPHAVLDFAIDRPEPR